MNQLYFGDNLNVLREHINDESVDLIYLDPPFNSKRDYNLLFKSPKVGTDRRAVPAGASPALASGLSEPPAGNREARAGTAQRAVPTDYSEAQITAFEDSWHWGEQAEREFDELVHAPNTDVSEMMQALRRFLGENDMMAYLTMMANRLLQLHRVLKPTGSLYLHCDPTASHYLKIVLDGVFGKENYQNEIIWKRTTTHSDSKTWSRVADTIFFYTKSTDNFIWNIPREEHSEEYAEERYSNKDADGRRYMLDNMTSPNPRPNMMYEWKGFPFPEKGWRFSRETMTKLDAEGRIWYPKTKSGEFDLTKRPRVKRYLDEMEGGVMGTIWTDIFPVNSQAQERLGYPTQKPLALLERIIAASSNEGDVVLDPFCGCGTAVHAAQKLNRQWIGIDITHLAISLIEKRLKDAFPELVGTSRCDVPAGAVFPVASGTGGCPAADGKAPDSGRRGAPSLPRLQYEIHGTPKDLDAARDLATRDKYQFQWWAVSLVEAQPFQGKKKGADGGIDGLKFFHDVDKAGARKIVVSVKGGGNLKADDIRSLMAVREREDAEIGLLISLEEPTRGMVADAASAGFYESATGKKYPRVQLLTIDGLLSGKQRAEHPDHAPDLNFKKAKAESNAAQKELI